MKIEVACENGDTNKQKGDLLEVLSKDLLEAQGYEVIEEIRFTAVELDLLCKNKVNGKQIYVECKAQKDKINSDILRKLLGTVTFRDYEEGWLISTADFGKEAKGFVEEWKGKPKSISSKLSFYSPELVVQSLQSASVIVAPPKSPAAQFVGGEEELGAWSLLISKFGRYWAVFTLSGGAPKGVLIYNAKTGTHIQDSETLENISHLDTTLKQYDLFYGQHKTHQPSLAAKKENLPKVVEVQTGDSWSDYRPARPVDFVGRNDVQKDILRFLKDVKDKSTNTRIFSIIGNSGLGKSSLIAKVRDRAANKFYKKKYFVYAIDVRGAKGPEYINSSLLSALSEAQSAGFGDPITLQLTDPDSPLSSESISNYLGSLDTHGQVVCLVFDQFEELYSKPDLFNVFKAAKSLMIDVAANKESLVLGFAWKTDSTTQQDHPAYHMWHELSDYRKSFKLDVFDDGEIVAAINIFEKEIGHKIPSDLRHQISTSCQGYPWLLKKLCINIYENIKKGGSPENLSVELDISRLFQADLDILMPPELTCLKIIAAKAPADWSEIIEISGVSSLNSLIHKRLVVKSGDRLNIYWDIFKDYLLTGNAPVLPFNYIPTTDFSSFMKVIVQLDESNFKGSSLISSESSLNEKTVLNIGADLVMFGIAERNGSAFKLSSDIPVASEEDVLGCLREKLTKHALKLELYKNHSGKTIDKLTITNLLKGTLPKASYVNKTWSIYATRLTKFLVFTGFLTPAGGVWIVKDSGAPVFSMASSSRRGRAQVFSALTSPSGVAEALSFIADNEPLPVNDIKYKGYRNSLAILSRFALIETVGGSCSVNKLSINKAGGQVEAIWAAAKNEPTLSECINALTVNPEISARELGLHIANTYSQNWKEASLQRNGNSLRQWAKWLMEGIETSSIPNLPGRKKQQQQQN